MYRECIENGLHLCSMNSIDIYLSHKLEEAGWVCYVLQCS